MDIPSILIVDDDRNILNTLKRALDNGDYLIEEATTGDLACRMIERRIYDCYLMDLRLPDVDGLEIIRRHELKNVIMITAHGNVEIAVEAMKLGCVDFLRKPFDLEEIRGTVHKVLERKHLAYEQGLQYDSLLEIAKRDILNKDFSDAIIKVRQVLEIKPNSSEAYNLLGALHEVMDEINLAIIAYKTALNLDPANEYAQHNLARLRNLGSPQDIHLGF
jgi:DNA-binding NtrC family response regulator